MNVAVLGSAFDPPTLGHLDVIKQCLEKFDEVWLVPSYKHAFDKKMSPYFHRAELAEAFAKDISDYRVKVQACEPNIKNTTGQPIYSLDLLHHLRAMHPENSYSLIIGPDNLKAFDKFYKSEQLKTEFSPFIAKERKNIRSTLVRQKVAAGLSITDLVTSKVCHYIAMQDLYHQ